MENLRAKLESLLDAAESVRLDNDVEVSKGENGKLWVSGFRLLEISPEGRMFIHFQGSRQEASPQLMAEEITSLRKRIALRNRQIRDLRRQLRK